MIILIVVAVLVLFVLSTVARAFRLPARERALVVPLSSLVAVVSVLESGMFDTAPAFIIFFTMTMFAHRIVDRDDADLPAGATSGHRPR